MTETSDDKRSQEAEDVAREIAAKLMAECDEHGPIAPEYAGRLIEPILARLVREGQIKVLREALEHEWVTREGGLDRHSVSSSRLRARIAALRQEG